jgi:hypothetical protein
MRVTRRRLVQALTASAALEIPAPAQDRPNDPLLDAAQQGLRLNASLVRQVQLPATTEPATKFSAKS